MSSVAPASEPPYLAPDEELRVLATRFFTLALGYDAWTEEQRDFLSRLQDLATKGEIQRLRRSGRAHLRWWVLRQRLEQAAVHVTGVSRSSGTGNGVLLEVKAIRVTRSTVSTVHDFVDVALVAVLALLFAVVVVLAPVQPSPAIASTASACLPEASPVADVRLDRQQWSVARDVINVARELRIEPRGWVVALAAGMQESGLRPLPYGDRDSLGVFQQRTAWGTVSQRMNPRSSARMFFTGGHGGQRGLLDVPGWERMPVTSSDCRQCVDRLRRARRRALAQAPTPRAQPTSSRASGTGRASQASPGHLRRRR